MLPITQLGLATLSIDLTAARAVQQLVSVRYRYIYVCVCGWRHQMRLPCNRNPN